MEFTRLVSLVAGLITHAVPLSKNGGGSHLHHPAYHSRRVLLMGYNGLHTRDPLGSFRLLRTDLRGVRYWALCSGNQQSTVAYRPLAPKPARWSGDGTETTIRHEAVVGEPPCPENVCSTSRYDHSSLPAQH